MKNYPAVTGIAGQFDDPPQNGGAELTVPDSGKQGQLFHQQRIRHGGVAGFAADDKPGGSVSGPDDPAHRCGVVPVAAGIRSGYGQILRSGRPEPLRGGGAAGSDQFEKLRFAGHGDQM